MDRASLAARIQEILKNRPKGDVGPAGSVAPVGRLDPTDESAAFAARCTAAEASSRVLEVLGARLSDDPAGACVVVDRDYPLTHPHGRHPLAHYHGAASAAQHTLPWFLEKAAGTGTISGVCPGDAREVSPGLFDLLFFDLETTGLSGGAGTYAFLVGFGWFDEGGFHTRQFFLRGYGEERALLHAVTQQVLGRRPAFAAASAGPPEPGGGGDACPTDRDAGPDPVLVTYNGRGFDVPLIDTRYQFNRLPSPFDTLAHVDMLFPARRLWKRRLTPAGDSRRSAGGGVARDLAAGRGPHAAGRSDDVPGSCALTALERDILGLQRQDDVPGWEIPARYFGYARTGDARGLEAVLEHNRLDLVSLGAVSAVILDMVAEGSALVRERPDCLALGRLLEYLGRVDDAERCYCAASESDGMTDTEVDRHARAEALHWLALHRRRGRRFQEAAEAWQQLVGIPGIDADRKREALEALAIHHEHRAKDLEAARRFALSALQLSGDARRVDDVRHRLGRLSRKLSGKDPGAQLRLGPR